ncbi:MAG TPA: hypothetical protein VGN20_01650 [Mucilaginibacter sp.]|jgi:hypothetical protein
MKIKKFFVTAIVIIAVFANYGFKYSSNEQGWLSWTNKCLAQSYDSSGDAKLKKWDLAITNDDFIRLRKTYQKGKQVYYSFNLNKLNGMDYFGDAFKGTIRLKAVEDDIIVQTYNDRKGDVDSMTTVMNIPVKNMPAERLDSLQQALNYFKLKGL